MHHLPPKRLARWSTPRRERLWGYGDLRCFVKTLIRRRLMLGDMLGLEGLSLNRLRWRFL